MKKILSLVVIMFGCSIINVNAVANTGLCLRLTNLSDAAIYVVPPATRDPGYEPRVEPKQNLIIGYDFTGCADTAPLCSLKIKSEETLIKFQPGAHVIYLGPNSYAVDDAARVQCNGKSDR
ncbi:MAG: hypothetical protein K0S27_1097 [Gammaproteobacteria bacterium]|jgi:hypothetical protein|nr:hypothetical protein [Gammaproteobacteria bacterium]